MEQMVLQCCRVGYIAHREEGLGELGVPLMGAEANLIARREDGTEFPVEIESH